MDHIYSLRHSVASLLARVSSTSSLIAGHTAQYWASLVGLSERDYVRLTSTPPFRAGTICDIYLAALVMGMSLWVVGDTLDDSMLSHSTAPVGLIRFDAAGYFVTYVPDDLVDAQRFYDQVTELPLQLIGEPRASSMLAFLCLPLPSDRPRAHLDTQYFHSHSVENKCHVRLLIAVPEHPDVAGDEPPTMQVSLSGIHVSRPLARWTSFALVAVELDIDSSDPDTLLSAYRYMDMITYNRLERIMEELLDNVSPILAPASEVCTLLLERAAMSSFATFRRFVHKFRFLIFLPGAGALERMTFGDFQTCCRLNGSEPFFSVFDDDTTVMPTVPCVVLAPQQVLHVCASLRAVYGVGLLSYNDAVALRAANVDVTEPMDIVEGGALSPCNHQLGVPASVLGGAKPRRVKTDLLVRIAVRVALPIVGGHMNEQPLTHLLRSDARLASSRSLLAAEERVIPHPTSIATDPVAQLHASTPASVDGTSAPQGPCVAPLVPAAGSAATEAGIAGHPSPDHSALCAAVSSLQLEVRTLVMWASQFEDGGEGPPGTALRSIGHCQLDERLQQLHEQLGLCKEDVVQTLESLQLRAQRLAASHNRLEGLLIAQQQRAEQVAGKVQVACAKLDEASQKCRAEVQQPHIRQDAQTSEPSDVGQSTIHAPDLIAKVAALSGQVDLCLRMCCRTLTANPTDHTTSAVRALDAQIAQAFELLRVHTVAISRTCSVGSRSGVVTNVPPSAFVPPPPSTPPPTSSVPPSCEAASNAAVNLRTEASPQPVLLPCTDSPAGGMAECAAVISPQNQMEPGNADLEAGAEDVAVATPHVQTDPGPGGLEASAETSVVQVVSDESE
eukprot:2706491-Amphidinium_carterae.1